MKGSRRVIDQILIPRIARAARNCRDRATQRAHRIMGGQRRLDERSGPERRPRRSGGSSRRRVGSFADQRRRPARSFSDNYRVRSVLGLRLRVRVPLGRYLRGSRSFFGRTFARLHYGCAVANLRRGSCDRESARPQLRRGSRDRESARPRLRRGTWVAKVHGFSFGFSRSFFNGTNFKREFMGNVHGARTIFFCHIRGLLQQRNDRATGVFGYEIASRPSLRCGAKGMTASDLSGACSPIATHSTNTFQRTTGCGNHQEKARVCDCPKT